MSLIPIFFSCRSQEAHLCFHLSHHASTTSLGMESASSRTSTDSLDASMTDNQALPTPTVSKTLVSANMRSAISPSSDSDSDVSMSAESEDDDEEDQPKASIQTSWDFQLPVVADTKGEEVSKKRRYHESLEDIANGHRNSGLVPEARKRIKPGEDSYRTSKGHLCHDRSLLPAEVWHQIFTFCPPKVLGHLLKVNKSFNAYLDTSSHDNFIVSSSSSTAPLLKPDAIWRASRRRLFWPGLPCMPTPLQAHSELDMWKMACCVSCQFCGKKRPQQPTTSAQLDPWHPCPGENGVNSIWTFALRTCGPCLETQSLKVGDDINFF